MKNGIGWTLAPPASFFTETIFQRKVWNPTGGMPEYLYVRRGVISASAVPSPASRDTVAMRRPG